MNTKVGEIAGEVGQTPSAWNGSIFSMIRNLSENVMIPIAGLIISAILCYELITMVMDKNNMHEVGSEFFFRYLVKACIAVMLLSKTFDITMAVFDVGNHIVTNAAGVISGSTSIDVTSTLTTMFNNQLSTMGIGVATHLSCPKINQIDCHRMSRYNGISLKKGKVPGHLQFRHR